MNTRRKGDKLVLQLTKELRLLGIKARKTSMSGQLSDKGDIIIDLPKNWLMKDELQIEVKAKKELPKWLKQALHKDKSDIVVLREDRGKTYVFMSWELLKELLS